MSKRNCFAAMSLLVLACSRQAPDPAAGTTSTAPTSQTTASATAATATNGDKTVAEKAFDAGMRGKQKAEQINAGQAERAAEADEAGQ